MFTWFLVLINAVFSRPLLVLECCHPALGKIVNSYSSQWVDLWPLKYMSTSYPLVPMNLALFGKRVFVNVIKLRILR